MPLDLPAFKKKSIKVSERDSETWFGATPRFRQPCNRWQIRLRRRRGLERGQSGERSVLAIYTASPHNGFLDRAGLHGRGHSWIRPEQWNGESAGLNPI